jgi:hypothetical protein
MKIYCIVLLVFIGALTLGTSSTSASNLAPQQLVGKRRVKLRAPQAAHVPLPTKVGKKNRFTRLPNGQPRSMDATPRTPYQSGLSRSAVVAKKGSIRDKSMTGIAAVRRPNLFPSSSASLDNLRHRGPNPAVIGGLPTSKTNERGAINGSRISRGP